LQTHALSVVLELGLLLMLSSQVASQKPHSVKGSVVFDNSISYQPVVVHLEPLSSRPVETVGTDESGNFTFGGVPEGTYYIRVKVEGFEEIAQRIEVPALDRSVTILLQRKAEKPLSEVEVGNGIEFEKGIDELSIPRDVTHEYLKALDEDKQGKFSGAISRLQRVLSVAPNFIQASFRLGTVLYKAGQFEEAEKVLVRALKTIPKQPHLRLMLTNVFLKENKYDEALGQIDAYLEENPNGRERSSAEITRSQLIEAISVVQKPRGPDKSA
jgi:tetratricopeptide (TPR) repeat protein